MHVTTLMNDIDTWERSCFFCEKIMVLKKGWFFVEAVNHACENLESTESSCDFFVMGMLCD